MVVAPDWSTPLIGSIANAIMALGSYAIAGHGLGQPRGLPRMLAASVVFWTACTVGLEVLGTFGAIDLPHMLAWAVTVFAVGSVARWRGRGDRPENIDKPEPEASLGWDAIVSLALVLAAGVMLAIPSLFMAVKVVSDGPIYHLYFAARWWKAGRLILVAAPFGENAATYFPANGDLWFTWLMASWGGELLAKVGQAPFLILAGAVGVRVCPIARRRPLGQPGGDLLVRLLDSPVPLLVRAQRRHDLRIRLSDWRRISSSGSRGRMGNRSDLVLGSLAAGAAIGTKAIGVVFLPPLFVAGLRDDPVPARADPGQDRPRPGGRGLPARLRRLLVRSAT